LRRGQKRTFRPTFVRRPAYIGAKQDGDPPVNHDWKTYSGTLSSPAQTKSICIALQIYGPGAVWFDELTVGYAE